LKPWNSISFVKTSYPAGQAPVGRTARAIAGNPIILSCIVGLSIKLSGMTLWSPIVTCLDLMPAVILYDRWYKTW